MLNASFWLVKWAVTWWIETVFSVDNLSVSKIHCDKLTEKEGSYSFSLKTNHLKSHSRNTHPESQSICILWPTIKCWQTYYTLFFSHGGSVGWWVGSGSFVRGRSGDLKVSLGHGYFAIYGHWKHTGNFYAKLTPPTIELNAEFGHTLMHKWANVSQNMWDI